MIPYNSTLYGPYTPSQFEAVYLISDDFFYYLGHADPIGMLEAYNRSKAIPNLARIFYIYYYHINEPRNF